MFKPVYTHNEAALALKRARGFINILVEKKILVCRKQGKGKVFSGMQIQKLVEDIWHEDFPNNIDDPNKREFLFQEYSEKAKFHKPKGKQKNASNVLAEISSN